MMFTIVTLAALCVIIAGTHTVALIIWARERRDLLNRIMAKDTTDYIRVTAKQSERKETKQQKRAKEWRAENE